MHQIFEILNDNYKGIILKCEEIIESANAVVEMMLKIIESTKSKIASIYKEITQRNRISKYEKEIINRLDLTEKESLNKIIREYNSITLDFKVIEKFCKKNVKFQNIIYDNLNCSKKHPTHK